LRLVVEAEENNQNFMEPKTLRNQKKMEKEKTELLEIQEILST